MTGTALAGSVVGSEVATAETQPKGPPSAVLRGRVGRELPEQAIRNMRKAFIRKNTDRDRVLLADRSLTEDGETRVGYGIRVRNGNVEEYVGVVDDTATEEANESAVPRIHRNVEQFARGED